MPKVKVKLTLLQEPIEVDEDELPSLRQQGLVEEEPAPAAAPEPATVKAAKTMKETS